MRGYRYAITETKINRQHQVLSLIQSARLTIEAQYGHRFLVPEGISVSEGEVVNALSSAREGVSRGQDYIAVGRKVKQLSVGGTTRDGLEVIVLTGLNAATLSDCLFNQLVEVLRRHSLSLESLVLTGIGNIDNDLMTQVIQEWLNEFELIQPMLRLPGRLRKLHGD